MELICTVINQNITCKTKKVVADSKNYLTARFVFLTDEWEGHTKTAIFQNGNSVIHVLLEGDECVVPWEVIKTPSFSISVFAGDLITTDTVTINVSKSGYITGSVGTTPTPDIYTQIMDKLESLQIGVDGDTVRVIIDEYMKANPIETLSEDDVSNIISNAGLANANDIPSVAGLASETYVANAIKNDTTHVKTTEFNSMANAYLGEKGINDILESESIEVVGNNLFNIEDNETEYKGVTIKVENNVITMQGEYTGTTNSSNIEIGSFTFNEDMSLYVSWWDVTGATVFAIKGDDLNLNFNVTEDSVNGNIRNFTAGTKYTVYVKINKTTTPTYINPTAFAPMLSVSKPTAYEPYRVETSVNRAISANFKTMMIDSLNQFKGKKLINFGDSIAYGAGNDGVSYAHIIAKKLGMSCMSFAKGGATVCQSLLTTNNVVDQVDSCTTENPDIILVEGGTNDISKDDFETSLGEMVSMETSTAWTDSITDDSKTTVAGSLEYIFKTLREKYPQAIIMYISVHKMSSRKIARQKTVHDVFKQICDKWSVPFIDVYEKGGMNTFLANMCLAYTQDTYNVGTGDATHPNGDGYNTFYVPMIMNEIKKHMEV